MYDPVSLEALVPALYTSMMSATRSDIEFLFNAAVRFHRSGNLQRASELYERIQSLQPRHTMAMNNQALIARALGRLDLALKMLQEANRQEPTNFEILANLGRISLQDNRPADAERYLKKALELRSSDCHLGNCLGTALRRQGKLPEARTVLLAQLAANPEDFDLLFNLGLVAAENDAASARCYFRQALVQRPGDEEVIVQLNKLGTDT